MALKDVLKSVKRESDSGKPSLIWALEKYLTKECAGVRPDDGYFHPSGLSDCARKEVYEKLGFKRGSPSPKLVRVFNNGTYVHNRIQTYLGDMGILKGNWQCPECTERWWGFKYVNSGCKCSSKDKPEPRYLEVPIEDEVLKMRGHGDGIIVLNGQDYLLEIKSINENGFKNLTGPMDKHRVQANLYMKNRGLKAVVFLYECKNDQLLKEYIVDYDPVLNTQYELVMRTALEGLKSHVLPERVCKVPADGKKRWCEVCELCFSELCYEEAAKLLKEAR